MVRALQLLTGAAALVSSASAQVVKRQTGKLPPVTAEGNAFYADGKRFFIRGVAYQPGGAADAQDPLLDTDQLKQDIANFEDLGINTIRIYTIDNSKNHDEAMKMLDDAGIYLALDANTPEYSLNRADLESLHMSYNDNYLQSVFATVDAFAGYNNLLLFFSGNEVINARNNTNAAPYIKAVTRDMRQYISKQADRAIPVGYSSADVAENIEQQANYFACGEDEWARSDFFAFNDYSWCSPSTLQTSGWATKVETYSDYSLPMFLSEFGCITNTRKWDEIAALYSDEVAAAWSGGLAYEYTLEENGYGLVELKGGKVTPNNDFDRLKDAYANTTNPTGPAGARKDTQAPDCPPKSKEWAVDTLNLPAIPQPAKKFMNDGAGKGPGLGGDGSHWGGTASSTSPDLSDGEETSENLGNGSPSSGTSSAASGGSSNSTEEQGENAAVSVSGASSAMFGFVLMALVAFFV